MTRDPRTFVGFRCSPQGVAYIRYVAERDHINFSEALRRLLAVGARHDAEATHGRPAIESARSGSDPDDVGTDVRPHRDQNGDGRSGSVPDVPRSIGDAVGVLIDHGLRPEQVHPSEATG